MPNLNASTSWSETANSRKELEANAALENNEETNGVGFNWRKARGDLYDAAAVEAGKENLSAREFASRCRLIAETVNDIQSVAVNKKKEGEVFRAAAKDAVRKGATVDGFLQNHATYVQDYRRRKEERAQGNPLGTSEMSNAAAVQPVPGAAPRAEPVRVADNRGASRYGGPAEFNSGPGNSEAEGPHVVNLFVRCFT